jgi:hypothetical protein
VAQTRLQVNDAAEKRLRTEISRQLKPYVDAWGSVDAAATALGIGRERLRKYLSCKMTPKADVVLVAMANWGLKLEYEGIEFGAIDTQPLNPPPPPIEQLPFGDFNVRSTRRIRRRRDTEQVR